jgi:Ca2+-binding EF-hand superfamily protein
VAAIASLTQDGILLKKVIPDQPQGFATGVFHFKFWHFGEWVDIVVDDRLPTYNGKLIFIHSTDDDEFWSALLEKAYAKLYGGYEALKGGKTSEAMTDFTGGLVESYDLTKDIPPNLFDNIMRHKNKVSLMSCSIKAERNEIEQKLDSGLVKGHAYSVTSAATVNVRGKVIKLLRIRNPWGQKEWTGDWSDNSPVWKEISSDNRKQLLEGEGLKEDGEFWMSYEDFIKHFTDFEVCSVTVSEMDEDDNKKSWNSIIINGEWSKSNGTAGGCRNYPTFVKNPQYEITLNEDADGDGKCSVLVSVMQKHRRKQKKMGAQDLCIGFSIYKKPTDGSAITKQYVDYNYSSGTSGTFTNAREIMKRFDFTPGSYVIIPCTFKPEEEGDFLLRIFSESYSEEQGANPTSSLTSAAPNRVDKLRQLFDKLAGADGEIDSEELQDLLTASVSKDMSSSVFNLDACRSMISMLDVDKNGTLDFEEFKVLLSTITSWKRMFTKYDKDRSGTLERNEITQAIRGLGYDLSLGNINILFNRFARKRKYMQLDDFAACLCRVKTMEDTFKKSQKQGQIQLSKDDFFKITLDA